MIRSPEPVPEWLLDDLIAHIQGLLLRLYMVPSMKGYCYHTFAILHAVQTTGHIVSITKEVYPVLAEHFQVSPAQVEKAMRRALLCCWNSPGRSTLEAWARKAGYPLARRPTNSEFLLLMAEYIRFGEGQSKSDPY